MLVCSVCRYVAIGGVAPDRCPVCGAKAERFEVFAGVSGLEGSKTESNLKAALAGESMANRRYLAFAQQAEREGRAEAAQLFRETAEVETAHAHSHLAYLAALLGTSGNLGVAIEGETYEHTQMYPDFARMAAEEGFAEIAKYFEWVGRQEGQHAKSYTKAKEALG